MSSDIASANFTFRSIRDQQNALITSLNLKLSGISKKRTRLYEDFTEGILDEEEYAFAKKAYDERILLIADAAFAFAVSQFGKQLVVIESRLDLKLDRRKHIGFEFVLPRIVRRTKIATLDG